MLDDFDSADCGRKHYGPILAMGEDFVVMRCSFCDRIFRSDRDQVNIVQSNKSQKRRSSKSCIQLCDWVSDDKTVTCNSCGYTGPSPKTSCAT